ncbi:Shwachman-Bodian-diamond syndrome protein [Westerdykella ornata]|uniref:Shwachman-Bodian-diamond syndrome protein n=1 Tax=Westerdykella ornata TaxID=318751 RepID=A0A6A6J8B1_WESOR|nr:Shwachman-Bodian-diamond syndrome protein [Westerdykella ornata]KAF2271876.1 Shwachman-Bodian-diamond syndrome protein [Westerdykella ornata]
MPTGIIQPSNQIKFTNLAVVRIKKGKKRFELACYKNKVMDWRNEVETDLDNVLQVRTVFANISRTQVASKADVAKEFSGMDEEEVLRFILRKGELQIGEKERHAQLDRVRNEVISMVAAKIVDPKTKRVYPPTMIEKALDQLSTQAARQQTGKAESGENAQLPKWTGVVPNKEAKPQALAAVKALVAHQPIPAMSAQMRLRVICPTSALKHTLKPAVKADDSEDVSKGEQKTQTVKDAIKSSFVKTESEDIGGDEWEIVGMVEPGTLKPLEQLIASQTKGRGRVEIIDTVIQQDDF